MHALKQPVISSVLNRTHFFAVVFNCDFLEQSVLANLFCNRLTPSHHNQMDDYEEDFDDASPSYLQPSYGDYGNYGEDPNSNNNVAAQESTSQQKPSSVTTHRGGSGKGGGNKVVFSSGTKASSPPAFNVSEKQHTDGDNDDDKDDGDSRARKLAEANAALDAMTRLMQAPTPSATSANAGAPGEAVERKKKPVNTTRPSITTTTIVGGSSLHSGSSSSSLSAVRRQSTLSLSSKNVNTSGPTSSLVSFSKDGPSASKQHQTINKSSTASSVGVRALPTVSAPPSSSSTLTTTIATTSTALSPHRTNNSSTTRPLAPPQSPLRSPGASPVAAARAPQPPSLSLAHYTAATAYIPMPTSTLELEAAVREKEKQRIELEKQVTDLRSQLAEVRERAEILLKERDKQLRAALRKTEQLQIENDSLQQQTTSAFQTAKFLEMDNMRRERELTSQKLSEENKKLMAQVRQMSRQMEDAAAAQGALPARLAAAMEEVRVERERSRRAKEELAKDKENSKRLHEQTIALTDSNRELKLKMQSMQQLMQQRATAGMSNTSNGGGGGSGRNGDDAKSVTGKSISGRSISGARSVFGGGKSVAGARSVAGAKQMSLSARTAGGGVGANNKKKPFGSGPGTSSNASKSGTKISMISSSSAPKAGTRAALAKGSLSNRARADISNAGHSSSSSNVIVIHSTQSSTTTPNKQQLGHSGGYDDNEGYGNGFSSPAGAVSGSPGVVQSSYKRSEAIVSSSSSSSPLPSQPSIPSVSQATSHHHQNAHNANWETEKLALLERLSALESRKEEVRTVELATQNPSATDLAHLLQESKEERERAQEKAHQLESTVGMLQRQLRDLGVSIRVNASSAATPSNQQDPALTTVAQPAIMKQQVVAPPLAIKESPYVTYDNVIKKQHQQQQEQALIRPSPPSSSSLSSLTPTSQPSQPVNSSSLSSLPTAATVAVTATTSSAEEDQYGADDDFETIPASSDNKPLLLAPAPVPVHMPLPSAATAPIITPSFSFGPKPSVGVVPSSSSSSSYTMPPQNSLISTPSSMIMGPAPIMGTAQTFGSSTTPSVYPSTSSSLYSSTASAGIVSSTATINNNTIVPTAATSASNSSATLFVGSGGGGSSFFQQSTASTLSSSSSLSSSLTSPPLSYLMQPPSVAAVAPHVTSSAAPSTVNYPSSRSMLVTEKVSEAAEEVTSVIEVSETDLTSVPSLPVNVLTSMAKPAASRGVARGAGFDPLLDDDDEDDVEVLTHGGRSGGASAVTFDRNNAAPTPSPFAVSSVPSAYTLSGRTSVAMPTSTAFQATATMQRKKNPMDLFSDDE